MKPVRLLEVELSKPLHDLTVGDADFGNVLLLVRLHTQPIGRVELGATPPDLTAAHYSEVIWRELGERIQRHLQEDGLVYGAQSDGTQTPPCLQQRESFLVDAPFVTVVVPTRDRPTHVAACLQSLFRLAYPRYEVVVVDSAPTTRTTQDLIRDIYADCARLRYFRAHRPGASRARNLGLHVASGDIVAFLDDDVVVDPHWLTEMARGFDLGPQVACVTGAVLPAELDTSAQIWFEEYGGFFKGFDPQLFDLTEHRRPEALYPYLPGAFGTGASMAFRSAILRAARGFDAALGPSTPTRGGEDLAAFLELVTHGHQLVYQATALSYHLHRRDYDALRSTIYAYGVGLSALMVRHLSENPREIREILRRLPEGLQYLLNPHSKKNSRKTYSYPRELSALELRGFLVGPFAYLLSRFQNS